MNHAAIAEADAIASEIMTPDALKAVERTLSTIRNGGDAELALRCLYGLAYMEGMLAMSKVGLPQ